MKKKNVYKIINITIAETSENVYHVTKQKLGFTHAPYNKNKNQKWQLRSVPTIKYFYSEMIFFGLDWEEMNNRLCKVSTA